MNLQQVGQAQALIQRLSDLVSTYKSAQNPGIANYTVEIPDATGVRHSCTLDIGVINQMLKAQADIIVSTLQSAGIDTTGWDA